MSPRHPHQLTENVKLLQKIVLEHRGKYLLLQRDENSQSRPLCWDLPGGNSEWPTNIAQPMSDLHQLDASREVEEETGIEVGPEMFSFENLVYFETFFDPGKQVFTVLCGWHVVLPSDDEAPEPKLSEEHIAARWVAPGEALSLDFGAQKGEFLPKILQAASRRG